MSRSLRARLSTWSSALVLAMALVAMAVSFQSAFDEASAMQDDNLRQIAALLYRGYVPSAQIEALKNAYVNDPQSRIVIQVLAQHEAQPPAPPGASTPGQVALPSTPRPHLPVDLQEGMQTVHLPQESWRVYVKYLSQEVHVAVAQQTMFRDRIAFSSALRVLTPILLLLPALLVVLNLLVMGMFHPLTRAARALRARSEYELGDVPTQGVPSEVLPFVLAINRQFERVRQVLAAQRRFVADAAHELRSPLTALTLQVERLALAPMPAQARERLHELQRGMQRVRGLLDQLLTLARMRELPAPDAATLAVVPVIAQVMADLLPQAQRKNIDLGWLEPQGWASGDAASADVSAAASAGGKPNAEPLPRDVARGSVASRGSDKPGFWRRLLRWFGLNAGGDVARRAGAGRDTATASPTLPISEVEMVTIARNLMDNAIRYTPEGGRVDVGLTREPNALTFWVEDSGPGMSLDELEHALEPFFRGSDTLESGSGLGLAIVKTIAEQHHATVQLHNRPDGGLRVSVSFVLG